METYIENIIKTGLANGLTMDQLMVNPEAAAKAYLFSQFRELKRVGKTITIKSLN